MEAWQNCQLTDITQGTLNYWEGPKIHLQLPLTEIFEIVTLSTYNPCYKMPFVCIFVDSINRVLLRQIPLCSMKQQNLWKHSDLLLM